MGGRKRSRFLIIYWTACSSKYSFHSPRHWFYKLSQSICYMQFCRSFEQFFSLTTQSTNLGAPSLIYLTFSTGIKSCYGGDHSIGSLMFIKPRFNNRHKHDESEHCRLEMCHPSGYLRPIDWCALYQTKCSNTQWSSCHCPRLQNQIPTAQNCPIITLPPELHSGEQCREG